MSKGVSHCDRAGVWRVRHSKPCKNGGIVRHNTNMDNNPDLIERLAVLIRRHIFIAVIY